MFIIGVALFTKEYIIVNQEFFVILSFLLVFYYLYKFSKDVIKEEIEYRENVIKNAYISIINQIIHHQSLYVKEYEKKYLSIWALGEAFSQYESIFVEALKKNKELYFKRFHIYKTMELNLNVVKKLVSFKKENQKVNDLNQKVDHLIESLKKLKGKNNISQ
jgi:hypothetical protein